MDTPTASTDMATFLAMLTSGLTSFLLFTTIFLFAGGVVGIIGRILSRN